LSVVLDRFTPTRVGTTTAPPPTRRRASVHPHARGDNEGEVPMIEADTGSPPRAWGQLTTTHARARILGSPPRAWGQRTTWRSPVTRTSVHPHARGDNSWCCPAARPIRGSPPRA